jgi:hypothetical protein
MYNKIFRDTNLMFSELNIISPKLTFTSQHETENKTCHLTWRSSNIQFSFFRNRTPTDSFMPSDWCHHPEHKYAAIRCLINQTNPYLTRPNEK